MLKDFQVYRVAIEGVRLVGPLIGKIERRDKDLARQLRRSVSSVPLNAAEGSKSQGRNRKARYHNAMGSAQEVVATLETAAALGYLQARELPDAIDRFDHVVAMLFKLCR